MPQGGLAWSLVPMGSATFNSIVLSVALAVPRALVACSSAPPAPSYVALHADSIQIGHIVSERWPDRESEPRTNPERRFVRVEFTKALRGSLSPPREVSVGCGAPFPAINAQVIVMHGPWGDSLAPDFYEAWLRKELNGGH